MLGTKTQTDSIDHVRLSKLGKKTANIFRKYYRKNMLSYVIETKAIARTYSTQFNKKKPL